MPRSTNAPARKAKKKRLFQLTKGYWGRRKNVWTVAKNAAERGLQYAYIHRKQKKRTFRSLWITRINAALKTQNSAYGTFMHQLKANNILLDRKVLADLAMNHPPTFEQLIKTVNS